MDDRIKSASVEATMGHGDCEDCGSFSHGEATITVEGLDPIVVGHDGHLGGGCWDGEELTLRRMALGLCGVAPFMDGELAEGIPMLDSGRRDNSGEREWIPAHEMGPWRRVDIELDTLKDDQWYPTPTEARWVGAGGAARRHVFQEGDWAPFWNDFCASFVDVEMSIDHVHDGDDGWGSDRDYG